MLQGPAVILSVGGGINCSADHQVADPNSVLVDQRGVRLQSVAGERVLVQVLGNGLAVERFLVFNSADPFAV